MTRIEGALLREHDSISMLEGVIDESAGFIIRQVSAMGLLRSSSFWDSDHFHCSSSHGSLVELAEIASSGEPEAPPLWALPIPVVDVGALASWMTRGVCSPLSSQVSVSNWHWLPRPNSISIGVGGANCARWGSIARRHAGRSIMETSSTRIQTPCVSIDARETPERLLTQMTEVPPRGTHSMALAGQNGQSSATEGP